MEKTPNCRCYLTSLVALIVLVLFPLMSECKEDTYTSLKEAKDVDYGSFVGLMGRRSAAHPNRRMAHTLADLVNHWKSVSVFQGVFTDKERQIVQLSTTVG